MSRLFDDALTQYLELDSAPFTGYPFTMHCLFNSDDITVNQTLMFVGDKDVATDNWQLIAGGAGAGDPVRLRTVAGGSANNANTMTGFSAGTWHTATGVGVSATERHAYIDGGDKGTSTNNLSPTGADRVSIGRRGDSAPTAYMSGAVAEAAIWNVALSDDEVAELGLGISPLFVRPQNIVRYWPLIKDDDNDLFGGFDLAAFNAPTITDHPPQVIYPPYKG